MSTNSTSPLRIAGVPEHFNLPWRQRAWLHATQPLRYDPVDYREAAAGTGAMTRALADNEIDLAILLTEGAVLDIARGGAHRIVKVYVDTPLEWGIHVAANSALETLDDIRGARYAISRKGSGSHVMAAVHAASQSWPADQLRYVQVDTLKGARRALPAGEAEVFFWEKTMTHPYVKAGEFRRLGTFQSPWPSFVVCASLQCLEQHQDRVRRLLNTINRLSGALQVNPDAPRLISNAYGITEEAASTWLSYTAWNTSLEVPSATLSPVLGALTELWPDLHGRDVDSLVHTLD